MDLRQNGCIKHILLIDNLNVKSISEAYTAEINVELDDRLPLVQPGLRQNQPYKICICCYNGIPLENTEQIDAKH